MPVAKFTNVLKEVNDALPSSTPGPLLFVYRSVEGGRGSTVLCVFRSWLSEYGHATAQRCQTADFVHLTCSTLKSRTCEIQETVVLRK